MDEAVTLILILPAMFLAIVFMDAAGDRGAADWRASTFVEAAADDAAEAVSAAPANPEVWEQARENADTHGRASTWGECIHSDPRFKVSVYPQPEPVASATHLVVLLNCPIVTSSIMADDTVTAIAVRPIR